MCSSASVPTPLVLKIVSFRDRSEGRKDWRNPLRVALVDKALFGFESER